MLNVINTTERMQFDDGFAIYPDKYVLLGYVEEDEGNIVSGIPVAIAECDDRDDIWKLFLQYFKSKTHGELFLSYFGDVESIGACL